MTPRISCSLFPQYLPDRHATVAHAVATLRANPVLVEGSELPVSPAGQDRDRPHIGDSAITEFVTGEAVESENRIRRLIVRRLAGQSAGTVADSAWRRTALT